MGGRVSYPDGRRFFLDRPISQWRSFCRYPKPPSQDLTWWELTNGAQEP